jgi:hypothetical protein
MDVTSWGRRVALGAALAVICVLGMQTNVLVAAWRELVRMITVQGDPVPASPSILSGHEVQAIESASPQAQAERLLERAINHYDGATDLIAKNIDGWRGKIAMEGALNGLFTTALNANDLRVRAAAVEIYLAVYDIGKTPEDLDRAMSLCDRDAGGRPHELFVVGLLGNRGVDPQRALDYLQRWSTDPDVDTRRWAVEGIAMLGTNESIAPLLRAFHDDPSPLIRERAACGLAQHGMLDARQRLSAIPELLRFMDDLELDAKTREWAFQALSDISGLKLGNNPEEWRAWWAGAPQPPAPSGL